MVEQTPPRLPATADSLAHKLSPTAPPTRDALAKETDIASLALERVEAIFAIIDALDLGLGGKDTNLLFDMVERGARIIRTARAEMQRLGSETNYDSPIAMEIAA